MIDSTLRYRVNPSGVVHEEIEGETIVIALAQGSYFSLGGSAPAIWARLVSGAAAAEIVTAFEGGSEVREAVQDLLERLAAEGLIVAA
ncbi:MAG TPA: PqqD family protein, partial [Thermoanaerobaculia bacterium]|nr:PqqD family protein [Thermoanaerobaculia bacterium]